MSMLIRTASDVISKGLNPSFPHSDLGRDGMLKVTSLPEVPVPAVISISPVIVPVQLQEIPVAVVIPEPEAIAIEALAVPAVISEPVKEEIVVAVLVAETTPASAEQELPAATVAEIVVKSEETVPVVSVVVEEKKHPKGGKGKAAKNQT